MTEKYDMPVDKLAIEQVRYDMEDPNLKSLFCLAKLEMTNTLTL